MEVLLADFAAGDILVTAIFWRKRPSKTTGVRNHCREDVKIDDFDISINYMSGYFQGK